MAGINDAEVNPKISFAMWLPTLWFMRAASKGITYWLNPEQANLLTDDYLEGSIPDRIFFTSLMTLGMVVLLLRNIKWLEFIKSNYAVFLFYLYIGLSVFWSDFRDIAVRRWFHTLGDLVMIMVILTEWNYSEAISRMFFRVTAFLLPTSIILIKYFRTMGVSWDYTGNVEMWTGVATHKNTLGQLSLLAALYCIWELAQKKRRSRFLILAILALAIFLLHGSGSSMSATSTIVCIVGCMVFLFLKLAKKKPRLIVSALCLTMILAGVMQITLADINRGGMTSYIAGSVGRDPTLTGRTELWNALIEIGSRKPILGVGFGSFWIGDLANNLWDKFTWHPEQGHNGYIDIYLEAGLVGVLFLVLMILRAIKSTTQDLIYDYNYGRFRFTLLMVVLIHNLTESSFGRPSHLMWLLFLLIAMNGTDYEKISARERNY